MITTLIFDFDGTIINTNSLIEEGLNYFAKKFRGTRMTPNDHMHLTGKTLEDQMAFINEEKAHIMIEQFKIWYKHHHNQMTAPFPGIVSLLNQLTQSGYRLAIVSNNSTESLEMGLKHLGLSEYFEYVITRDDVNETKPSPEGLIKLMTLMNLKEDEALFIGDTGNDIIAAKNAGVANAMVGWSSLTVDKILALEPDYVIAAPSHLLDILKMLQIEAA